MWQEYEQFKKGFENYELDSEEYENIMKYYRDMFVI